MRTNREIRLDDECLAFPTLLFAVSSLLSFHGDKITINLTVGTLMPSGVKNNLGCSKRDF